MKTINAQQLKSRLDSGSPVKLVNAMEENKFQAMHIPGSLNLYRREDIEKSLKKDDEIIAYCTDESCNKSILLYNLLEAMGYKNVTRFGGGMREWEEAGYSLEGDKIK